MTLLPTTVPKKLKHNAQVLTAYDICLKLENTLQLAVKTDGHVKNDLIYIRILGHLIHCMPTPEVLHAVVTEIIEATNSRAILDAGKTYFDDFLRLCMFLRLPVKRAF